MESPRVLVTGSSRGIGRAIALELAQNGWKVAVHYSQDDESARRTLAELGSAAAGMYKVQLSDKESATKLWSLATADGPVNALVNNAGIYRPVSFANATDSEFWANYEYTMAVNLDTPVRLMRLAVQTFKQQGSGKILNVASRVGFRGEANASPYSASKAALINFTRALAVELSGQNIRLFGIAPGWVETAMAREGMDNRLEQILRDIPLGRMATVDDCAKTAAFLLSPGAEYLSGNVIDINGASYFH